MRSLLGWLKIVLPGRTDDHLTSDYWTTKKEGHDIKEEKGRGEGFSENPIEEKHPWQGVLYKIPKTFNPVMKATCNF